MERLLADETILRIFSYLDAADLVRLQSVSSHLRALAKDRHLWKRLFYFVFVKPTLDASSQDARGTNARTLPTLREIRSLLLHQNLPSGKAVFGDGSRRIHGLPRQFYDDLHKVGPIDANGVQADEIVSLLYETDYDLRERARDHLLDWERLYRVSSNWQGGNFAVSQLLVPERTSGVNRTSSSTASSRQTIVRVSNSFIFTAESEDGAQDTALPSISVYESESSYIGNTTASESSLVRDLSARTLLTLFSSPGLRGLLDRVPFDEMSHRMHATEIAVDAIPSADTFYHASANRKRKASSNGEVHAACTSRVLVAYSNGYVSVCSLHMSREDGLDQLQVAEDIFFKPNSYANGEYVAMAAVHWPLLVLCSSRFHVSIYRVTTLPSGMQLGLVQRMSSYRCSWPASLRLKPLPYHDVAKRTRQSSSSYSSGRPQFDEREVEQAFRITLAYSTPSYPSSWSVSVQELVIRLGEGLNGSSPARVTNRHATAKHPFRPTPIDLRGRSMLGPRPITDQPTSLANASRTTSLTYDDPFVVVGASDNLLEVYELLGATTYIRRGSDPARSSVPRSATATPSSSRDTLRLVHRRSLHGHTGSVHSVSLEDGRCVSGSADGCVMVWSLGDRANETDSIASIMRDARARKRGGYVGVSGRSTSSTIREEEEADEAASHMTHVLTLRTPMSQEPDEKHNTENQARLPDAQLQGPSLGHLVRSRVLDRQARGVIRWVSTAFDKIVSIISYTDVPPGTNLQDHSATQYPSERVQIWSFG